MSSRPPPPLIADVVERTRNFLQREAGLLLPVGFATFGLGALLLELAIPEGARGTGAPAEPGASMLLLIPALLLFLLGHLAVPALVLNGGVSVREALGRGVERIGAALALVLLFAAAVVGLILVGTLISVPIASAAGQSVQSGASLVGLLVLPAIMWGAIRLLTLWPAVAAAPARPRPIATLRAAFASTRGMVLPLAAVSLLYGAAYLLMIFAVQFGLGSVLLLAGRATGQVTAATLLLGVFSAMAGAAFQAAWSVFTAFLYGALRPASSGI